MDNDYDDFHSPPSVMTRGVGTLLWSAPEVIEARHYTLSCDVFSFGVVMWEIASRRLPLEHLRSSIAVAQFICAGQREAIPDNTPEGLAALIEQCWQQQPAARPTFAACVDDLADVVKHVGVANPVSQPRAVIVPPLRVSGGASGAVTGAGRATMSSSMDSSLVFVQSQAGSGLRGPSGSGFSPWGASVRPVLEVSARREVLSPLASQNHPAHFAEDGEPAAGNNSL